MTRVKWVSAAALAVTTAFLLGLCRTARAQYGGDPYRNYSSQAFIDHMNARNRAARLGSGKASRHKSAKRTTAAAKSGTAHRAAAAPLTGVLTLSQDMYSDFGRNDAKGYTLEVCLTPQNSGGVAGKPLTRVFVLKNGETSARITGLAPGHYVVTAQVKTSDGALRPARVGTKCGEPTQPMGGDFAPSRQITLEKTKDAYGNTVVAGQNSLWFRP